MEVKEAIEWIKTKVFCVDTMGNEKKLRDFECNQDSVISLLQQGEAYRQIVRDVETMLLPAYFIDHAPELEQFRRLFKETKQKYLPEDKLIQE